MVFSVPEAPVGMEAYSAPELLSGEAGIQVVPEEPAPTVTATPVGKMVFETPASKAGEFDAEAVLAQMMEDALTSAVLQERPVYLQNDSWSQIPEPGDWAGLIFTDPSQSILRNCVVEFAQTGVQISNALQGAMTVSDSRIRGNWLGILCSNTRANIVGAVVNDNVISVDAVPLPGTGINPSGTGLMCILSAQPIVSYSTFQSNELNGVGILDTSRPNFGETGNTSSPGRNNFRRPLGQNFMFNGTALTIYAQFNFWDLLPGQTPEDVIYDDTDDPSRGPIIWGPEGADLTGVDSGAWKEYR